MKKSNFLRITSHETQVDLDFLFNPRSIAVIGASGNKKKLGYLVLNNIIKFGYKGKIYPVNPKRAQIKGLECYKSVLNINRSVDLAVVILPSIIVPAAVEECGKKGVRGVIIISAGFKETGLEGEQLENRIKSLAKEYGMRILGPNCLGVINTASHLNASFAESMPKKWDISVFSQSGAMCTAILDWANANDIGFSKFVSLGNKSDLSETDLLKAWEKDKTSDVILGYLEGIEDGEEFLKVAGRITKKKPLVIIKSGSSDEGARAISSHTGSLAGFNEAAEAAFKHAGIIRAKNIEDLFDYCRIFSFSKIPSGKRVAVVTNAGGPGVMATDCIDSSDILDMAYFSQKSLRELKKILPKTSNLRNPIDVIGDANAARFESALQILVKDKNVDMILVILTPQVTTEVEETARAIARLKRRTKKPIVASFIGGNAVRPGIDILEESKIAVFGYPERAIKSMEVLYAYSEHLKKTERRAEIQKVDKQSVKEILESSKGRLVETEVSGILNAYGIPLVRSVFSKDKESAIKAAKEIGYPVVLKVSSPDIFHKTDVGGVKLNINKKSELEKAYDEIIKMVRKNVRGVKIDGVSVSHLVSEGQEVIIGAKRDHTFGPMIMFGMGGIYVELLKDVVFRLCPVSKDNALRMINEIRASGLLKGYRGKRAFDINVIADVLVRLSQLMVDFPEIKEIDINPLRVNGKGEGAVALDAKIVR